MDLVGATWGGTELCKICMDLRLAEFRIFSYNVSSGTLEKGKQKPKWERDLPKVTKQVRGEQILVHESKNCSVLLAVTVMVAHKN